MFLVVVGAANVNIAVPVNEWYTTRGTTIRGNGVVAEELIQWGLRDAWENDFANQTIDVDIQLEFYDSEYTSAIAVKNLIDWSMRGLNLAIGYPLSEEAIFSAKAATTYGVAQLSSVASSERLSNKQEFPYFSRLGPTTVDYGTTVIDFLLRMSETHGEGWLKIAILTTSDQYGTGFARGLIAQTENTGIEVALWKSVLPGTSSVTVEVREVVRSDARIILVFCSSENEQILLEAERQGLVDANHVFLGGSVFTRPAMYLEPDGDVDEPMVELLRGQLAVTLDLITEGERYERFLRMWNDAEMAGENVWKNGTKITYIHVLYFDLGVWTAHTVMEARRQGLLDNDKLPTAEEWALIARSISFDGVSGPVKLKANGDRPIPLSVSNWRSEAVAWQPIGLWTPGEGFDLDDDQQIIWHDNTTNVPDLLLQPGYSYWSCDAGKKYFDDTGHSVTLHTPDSGGFDDIDSHFICDRFIDCPNMSDESGDCSANYTALFIAFGIITGLLIVATCCLIPFVIVFGFVVPRRRVKASSPTFLLIIILSCILGYISEYSWYGRPQPVACGFRPWLLGLAVVSLVSALNAKTWRLWRVFKTAYKKERITDIQLIVLYLLMITPAVIILVIWTIVSTPTAGMGSEHDGHKHYVCKTGGFTGEPGGMVFFFILVAYESVVLLVAALLCIATRNVPSFFNESKLIAISIYNLGFLAAVVIPVIIVLDYINPFASWVIRSVAVLYAFTATLVLQFAPKVLGIIFVDRGADTALPKLGKTSSSSSSSNWSTQPTSSME